MSNIEVVDLSFWYKRSEPPVIYKCDFELQDSEFLAIVGASGCGKSTLLRLTCGLLQNELREDQTRAFHLEGAVRFDGQQVRRPHARFAYVPQVFTASLIPGLTALQNILVAVRSEGISQEERKEAEWLLRVCGISDVGHLRAKELSGGQQQRVAICRSLIKHPKVLFMDEPFANLDPTLKPEMGKLLNNLRDRYSLSILMVTHDLSGGIRLADRVLAARRDYGRPSYRSWSTDSLTPVEVEEWFG